MDGWFHGSHWNGWWQGVNPHFRKAPHDSRGTSSPKYAEKMWTPESNHMKPVVLMGQSLSFDPSASTWYLQASIHSSNWRQVGMVEETQMFRLMEEECNFKVWESVHESLSPISEAYMGCARLHRWPAFAHGLRPRWWRCTWDSTRFHCFLLGEDDQEVLIHINHIYTSPIIINHHIIIINNHIITIYDHIIIINHHIQYTHQSPGSIPEMWGISE